MNDNKRGRGKENDILSGLELEYFMTSSELA